MIIRHILLALSYSPALFSLSLQEALDQGLAAHALLESADARIRSAEGVRVQAGLKPNPRVFLQSENSRAWGMPPFVYARDADSFVYASQVIEAGGKRTARTSAAEANVQRQTAERQTLRWQLAARIGIAYWTAAGAAQYRDAFARIIGNFDETVHYHRDRVREGAMAEVDFLRIQLEAERLRAAFGTAEQEATAGRIRLFREMGQPDQPGTAFTEAIEHFPLIELRCEAITQRPDIRTNYLTIEQANANVGLQKANSKPDPEVLAGYKRTNGLDTLIAGVQINLPFRNRNEGNIAAAEAEVHAAKAALRAAEQSARTEAAAAFTVYTSRRGLVTVTLPVLRERGREIARIAAAAYREGGTDLLRLLDAERARIDADLFYYRALTEFHVSVVELQSALGTLR